MGITRGRFDQGMTLDQYRDQMTRNRDRFVANEETVSLDAGDLAYFAGLEAPLNVLVLAEDWCGDVIANLPVLGCLARESRKLVLRIFLRDQNLDLMDQYLKGGEYRSIPTFVFFDTEFRELGRWIERPTKITQMREQMRQNLFRRDPLFAGIEPEMPIGQLPEMARERLREEFARFREEYRTLSDREVVREIRALVEQGDGQVQPTLAPPSPRPVATTAPVPADLLGGEKDSNGVKVTITYCADCGYEPQTLELTAALMRTFIHELSSIELVPWHDGSFDVVVNGDLIHSMYRDGGFPEDGTIIDAVRERIS